MTPFQGHFDPISTPFRPHLGTCESHQVFATITQSSRNFHKKSALAPARILREKSSTTKPLHPLKAPRSHPEASRRPERRSHGPSLPGAEVRHSYPKGEGLRDPRTLHPSSQHCIPRVQRFSRAIAQRQSPLRMSKSLKRRPPEQRG